MLLPGFEMAVIGLEPGETNNIHIPTEEAYGVRDDMLVGEIPRNRLPEDLSPQVGMKLQMRRPDGEELIVTITDLTETDITVDANHQLAGKDLNFEIELVEIL
jgi:peptidylprolyl isomerase